jgi:hypothetical protein
MAAIPPLVSPPEFIAYPNYLDLDDLVPGGDAGQQTAELVNTLRRVSSLMDGYCRRKIRARSHTETIPVRAANGYAFTIKQRPFLGWVSITYTVPSVQSFTPQAVDIAAPVQNIDGMWQLPYWAIPQGWSGVELTVTYLAGWPVTALSGAVEVDAESIGAVDPTGIFPGSELRIYDPGQEEDIEVAAGYIPGDLTIPLTSPLLYAHATGVALDALPQDIHESAILWTMGLLARPTSGGEMDPFSDTSGPGPTTEGKDPRRTGTGLIRGAKQILDDHPGLVRAA